MATAHALNRFIRASTGSTGSMGSAFSVQRSTSKLLAGDDELRPAVLRPRRFVVPRIEWKLLAVADRAQPVGRDAERHKIVARCERAALAERQVVLCRAALVGVPFNRNHPRRIFLENLRVRVQRLLACAIDVGAVV